VPSSSVMGGRRPWVAKPGACPVVLRGSLGPCLELCDTDGDCPGAAKCCTTGCGHVCKPPTEARPGLCPPVADGDQAAECLLLCLQDKECPPGQKCCLRDCGRACVPPLGQQLPDPSCPPRPPRVVLTQKRGLAGDKRDGWRGTSGFWELPLLLPLLPVAWPACHGWQPRLQLPGHPHQRP
uniref:WAP domain-containing protein n=1 Tax=Accipiter nisus TaxID=211598 RepID=A0A8B9MR78_9AVES